MIKGMWCDGERKETFFVQISILIDFPKKSSSSSKRQQTENE